MKKISIPKINKPMKITMEINGDSPQKYTGQYCCLC